MGKKCSVYLRNANLDPAAYYRIYQYAKDIDCELTFHSMFTDKEFKKNQSITKPFAKKLYQAWLVMKVVKRANKWLKADLKSAAESELNCIFVQRSIVPRMHRKSVYNKLQELSKTTKILWDFDDNIVGNGEIPVEERELLTKGSDRIIVTHEYLRDTLPYQYHEKVVMLPTTDLQVYEKFEDRDYTELKKSYEDTLKLIWMGSSAHLDDLERLIPVLDDAVEWVGKKVELTVVCNREPKVISNTLSIKYVPWSRTGALEELAKAHIGIMPLSDNSFTRGKGAFKLIQYMGAGIPVVGSAVGFNTQVIRPECGYLVEDTRDWKKALSEMAKDATLWESKAKAARRIFEGNYNPEDNINVLEALIVK